MSLNYDNDIDIFNIHYLDDVIDLIFDIKEYFYILPYFLYNINCQNLIHLFLLSDIQDLSNDNFNYLKVYDKKKFYIFYTEFHNEINYTFIIMNSFLKNIKYHSLIDYKIWCLFCFKYSDIHCL